MKAAPLPVVRPWDHPKEADLVPPWRGLLLEHALRVNASRSPEGEAIRFEGTSTTWGELDRMADRAANGLLAHVGQPGDIIALKAINEPATIAMMFGMMRAGISMVPINPMSSDAEITFQMEDAGATQLLSPEGRSVPEVIALGAEGTPDVYVDERAPYWYRFTGGTTGVAKCMTHSQRAIYMLSDGIARELGYRSDDRVLLNAPLAHAATAFLGAAVIAGATMVVTKQFNPATLWQEVDTEGVTRMFMVPTMAVMARRSPGHGSSLRQVVFAASSLPRVIKEEMMERFPDAEIVDMFGSSELGMITLLRGWEDAEHPASVGLPRFGYSVRILDDDGEELPRGEVGLIYAHGPAMSGGFIGREPAAENAVRDGWVTAGDMGYLDAQGYLHIADRRADLIISGGLNVYPAEVEDALMRHPSVTEAVVVGVTDPTWGQRVAAFVVGDIDESALDAHCRQALAGYKVPRQYVRGESVPRTPTGKPLRRIIRDQLNGNASD